MSPGGARGARAAAPATWDANAARYGRQERWESAAVRALVRLAAPRAGETRVDVGTGTGLVLRTLAAGPASSRPTRAIGVDRSPGMLARVGELPPGWSVVAGDATALPLDDASADVVVSLYVLHLLDPTTRAAAAREMARVVRPGGRVVVGTVWATGGAGRAVLGALAALSPARLGGLRPVGPFELLAATPGLRVGRVVDTRGGGYPTRVVLATRG